LRFFFIGDWCPIPEDISFEDEDGNPIPATIFFNIPTQLVENGPPPPQIGLIKPLMSLELSTDYTLTLSPPNPALSIFQDYSLTFRTARAPVEVDYGDFAGVEEVVVDGNLCEGEGLYLSDSENFDCIVPSYMNLKVSFRPLAVHEASYLIYRVSSRPHDDGNVDLIDEVERPLAYVPGVSAERAQRSIDATVSVLYAPFPREECFKVVVLDGWGRERAGVDEVSCINLSAPKSCSDLQFPEPNPFENTPPLEGAPCEAIGINGATGRTQIPPLEEMNDDSMDDDSMDEETMDDESMDDTEEGGCAQGDSNRRGGMSAALYLLALGWLIGLGPRRRQIKRARSVS
jgi:hypothetical protein